MDRYSHTKSDEKDSSKQNDTRIPKKASPDFFSKTTDLSPGKNNEDFGRKLLDLYKQRRLLQQQKESLSKQTDQMLRTRISSPFPTINHAFPDLKLHDLPELTKEGVYIPGCDTKQPYKKDEERHQTASPLHSELQKSIDRTFGSSKNMNDNIDQIAVSVHDVSSDFYYNSVPKESKNIFNSGLKANHFNHVYIYYNICERIFTNKSASFDPGVVQQTQKEFRERRNLLEQSIGFPDVQNLLEQESPKNKGFISENMHKDLKDEYNRIESQGYYYKSRLEDLGELRGKFHSAQKVYEFLGVRADYEVPTKTLQDIQSSHELSENTLTPEEIQLSHDLSERIQNVANESRWDKAMEKVTEVIADEYINTDLRMRVAETVGVIGSSTSSIETRRPIAEHLVGLLDKEKIDKYVGMSVAETVGVIRE